MLTLEIMHFMYLFLVIYSTLHIPTILFFSNEDGFTMTNPFVMKTIATTSQCHVLKGADSILVRNPMIHGFKIVL